MALPPSNPEVQLTVMVLSLTSLDSSFKGKGRPEIKNNNNKDLV